MQSTYRVKADELTSDFLKALKYTYRDKEIEIVVSDIVDETEYLLGTEANREHLLASIREIEAASGLITTSTESLGRL
jgi:antitoxin YefM